VPPLPPSDGTPESSSPGKSGPGFKEHAPYRHVTATTESVRVRKKVIPATGQFLARARRAGQRTLSALH
jgi:hypothetical protein